MTIHQMEDSRPRYLQLKDVEDQIKSLTERRKQLLEELVPQGNYMFDYEGQTYQAKVVTGKTQVVDLMSMRKKFPVIYDAVTKRVLDRTALKQAIDMNKIPLTALDLITEKDNASFIRLSKVNDKGEVIEDDEEGVA